MKLIERPNNILRLLIWGLPNCILQLWTLDLYKSKMSSKFILRLLISTFVNAIFWYSSRISKYTSLYFPYSDWSCGRICVLFSYYPYWCILLIRPSWGDLLVKLVLNVDKCISPLVGFDQTRIHAMSYLRQLEELGIITYEYCLWGWINIRLYY